jgi:hypothetical protein
MKSIDIKGKKYIPVNERLIYFRDSEAFNKWTFRIKVFNKAEISDHCLMRGRIMDELGQVMAEDWAYERADGSFINKLSHVENCATSVMGRCLGQLGIGIEESVASFEEVANNISQQDDKPWMNHKVFNEYARSLNEEADDKLRAQIYRAANDQFRMKKDYRRQLLEIVEQRDIQV